MAEAAERPADVDLVGDFAAGHEALFREGFRPPVGEVPVDPEFPAERGALLKLGVRRWEVCHSQRQKPRAYIRLRPCGRVPRWMHARPGSFPSGWPRQRSCRQRSFKPPSPLTEI